MIPCSTLERKSIPNISASFKIQHGNKGREGSGNQEWRDFKIGLSPHAFSSRVCYAQYSLYKEQTMEIIFTVICLSIVLAMVLISLLSNSSAFAKFMPGILLAGGISVALLGWGVWMFGGLYGSLGDSSAGGAAMQSQGLIIARMGGIAVVVGLTVGALRWSKHTRIKE
jgi:hypothetical protein